MGKLKVILSILTLICVALSFSACFGGEESALTFQLLSDGTYALTDCVMEESGEVIIPETYKGKKVTKIGDEAFKHCFLIEGITIPKSIKSIGADALFGTERLTKINYLGSWDDWVSIDFEGDASNGSNPVFFSNNLYINDVLLTDAVINANTIKANSLSWCYSLRNVVIGENVKRIDKGVFVFL